MRAFTLVTKLVHIPARIATIQLRENNGVVTRAILRQLLTLELELELRSHIL